MISKKELYKIIDYYIEHAERLSKFAQNMSNSCVGESKDILILSSHTNEEIAKEFIDLKNRLIQQFGE